MERLRALAKPKLVMTCAVMDLLHEGHIALLKRMNSLGDITLVVLHDGFTTFKNKKKLPIENLEKRTRNLVDTGLVDIVKHTFEEEPHSTFEKIIKRYQEKFDIIFMRADDWEEFPGISTIRKYKIPIVYVSYTDGVSSTKIRKDLCSS